MLHSALTKGAVCNYGDCMFVKRIVNTTSSGGGRQGKTRNMMMTRLHTETLHRIVSSYMSCRGWGKKKVIESQGTDTLPSFCEHVTCQQMGVTTGLLQDSLEEEENPKMKSCFWSQCLEGMSNTARFLMRSTKSDLIKCCKFRRSVPINLATSLNICLRSKSF